MRADDPILAASLFGDHSPEITAALSIALAFVIATFVDRLFAHRVGALAEAVTRGELTPVANTRLRFVRRAVTAVILLIGILIAISQFAGLSRLATSLLASSALAAAVIGFAARQVLANTVAGLMLAITQPLRIGDIVSFEGTTGTVEDVRLNYTYLRTADERRVIIPNERLVGGVLRNDSIVSPRVHVEVSIWLQAHVDLDRALQLLATVGPDGEDGAAIAESAPEGVRVVVQGGTASPTERAGREAELRRTCLRLLRDEGLLEPVAAG